MHYFALVELWVTQITVSEVGIWQKCLQCLQEEFPAQQFNTWLRPLQAEIDGASLVLLAPNRFVVDWVRKNYYERIKELVLQLDSGAITMVSIEIGSKLSSSSPPQEPAAQAQTQRSKVAAANNKSAEYKSSFLDPRLKFDHYVQGNSNQLAYAASQQVALKPGEAYNPLFIYGGVGLGKTHLMHAIGNEILKTKPEAKVL